MQASHWCPKKEGVGCGVSCGAAAKPTPANYCVKKGGPGGGICHGTSAHGSQASNSLALSLGAPPDEATAALVAKNLAEDVMGFGNKTTTGVVGIAFLFPMLDKYGYGDIGLATLLNDDCSSQQSNPSVAACVFLLIRPIL